MNSKHTEEVFTLVFTQPEIEWILLQLNPPVQSLYASFFREYPPSQVNDILEQARTSLLQQGLIIELLDEGLKVDIACAGIVGVLGFSKVVLQVDIYHEQSPTPIECRYYVAEHLIVEEKPDNDDRITLTALRDIETLHLRLYERLGLRDQREPTQADIFNCQEEAFADIPYILAGDGESAAIAQLVEIGADEHFAADLIGAMNAPVQQATLQVVHLDPEHPEGVRLAGKLNLLEGVYGLWALRSQLGGAVPLLQIMPCNAEHARELVDTLLGTFIASNGET